MIFCHFYFNRHAKHLGLRVLYMYIYEADVNSLWNKWLVAKARRNYKRKVSPVCIAGFAPACKAIRRWLSMQSSK